MKKFKGTISHEESTGQGRSYLIPEQPILQTHISAAQSSGHKLPQKPMQRRFPSPTPARLLSIKSSARTRWDLCIMCLGVWNCFYVPFSVAFVPEKTILILTVIDVFIDVAYLFDIIVFARSTYIDLVTGEEVTNTRAILRNYLTSMRLFVDVVSAFPWDVISLITAKHAGLQFFTLSKVIRLLRFSKALTFLQAKAHVKLTLKLLHLIFLFVIYLHLQACLWNLLITENKLYRPPAMYVVHHPEIYDCSIWRQYAFSMYMSVYMLTGAEIGPRTEWERIFVGCALIVGQLFQAFMFGEIAVVMFDLSKRNDEIAEIHEAANTSMSNMQLEWSLRGKVSVYLHSMQGELMQEKEYAEFFVMLPPSLKQEVRGIIFAHVLKKNPPLGHHAQIVSAVLQRLSSEHYSPEQTIVAQGEAGDRMFFVASGKCEVSVTDERSFVHFVKYLVLGAHFGEVALLYPTARTAKVAALTQCTLAVLHRPDFEYICSNHPKVRSLMLSSTLRYEDVWKQFQLAALRRCEYFRKLKDKVLSTLVYHLPLRAFQENETVCTFRDRPNCAYFLLEGAVEVSTFFRERKLMEHRANRLKLHEKSIEGQKALLTDPGFHRDVPSMGKVTLDVLGPGSVLCSGCLPLGEKVSFSAKALRFTVAMTLPLQLLEEMRVESSKVRSAVDSFHQGVSIWYNSTRLHRLYTLALDYMKAPDQSESAMHCSGAHKAKRCIMQKLLEKRQLRAMGFNDINSMANKLKAVAAVEDVSDPEMLEKIRVGAAPSSQHLLEAYQMLEIAEVSRPLVMQFAIHSSKVAEESDSSLARLRIIRNSLAQITQARNEAIQDFSAIKKMIVLSMKVAAHTQRQKVSL